MNRTRQATVAFLLTAYGCINIPLQETNIADGIGSLPLLDASDLQNGYMVFDHTHLDALRMKATEVSISATIHARRPLWPNACTGVASQACLELHGQGTELVPAVSGTLPQVLPLAATIEGTFFDAINSFHTASSPEYQLSLSFNPASLSAIDTRGVVVNPPISGLYFSGHLSFGPQEFLQTFHCICPDISVAVDCIELGCSTPISPAPIPFAACDQICERQADTFDALGFEDTCDDIFVRTRLNRMPIKIGFQPTLPALPDSAGAWTDNLFPGSKNFHLGSMFDVNLVVGSRPYVVSHEDELDDVDGDLDADVAFAFQFEGCTELCSIIDCDGMASVMAAETLENTLGAQTANAIQTELAPLFDFQGPLPPPCTLPPCPAGTPNCCTIDEATSWIAASATYQKWDWFAGAFGPYGNGAFLPIDQVASLHLYDENPTTQDAVLFTFDADEDHDGALTPYDNCPYRWNPAQSDTDTDGDDIPDDCDDCELDPFNDADADGWCANEDNCPQHANTSQANCNIVSEQAHTPGDIRGDACDPVPCPFELSDPISVITQNFHTGGYHSQVWLRCWDTYRNRMKIRPIGSHSSTEDLFVETGFISTSIRFCQKNEELGILCDQPEDIQDALMAESGCVYPPQVCANPETLYTKFHRMSFTEGGNGASPNGNAPLLIYDHDEGSDGPYHLWEWDFEADLANWQNLGLISNAVTAYDLQGTLWIHAQTEIGDQATFLGTGFHGDQLSNHHKLDFRVKEHTCDAGAHVLAIVKPFFLFKTLPDPPPDAFVRWDGTPGETELVVRNGASYVVIDGDGNGHSIDSRISAGARALLDDRALVWANAAEPFAPRLGARASFPLAVALSADGGTVVGSISTDGASLLGGATRGAASHTRGSSPQADGFVPVLSETKNGVFVIGGRDPSTGVETGEMWFMSFEDDVWQRVRSSIVPDRVLAATYTFRTDELVVLDEPAGRDARLWALSLRTRSARELGRWPRHRAWSDVSLTVDLQGAVLLASSNASEQRYAIARFDLTRADVLEGIERGTRALPVPPVADARGYTLIQQGRAGWPREVVAAGRSFALRAEGRAVGDVVVTEARTGPAYEARIDPGAVLEGSVAAHRVRLLDRARVSGLAAYNILSLAASADIEGGRETPMAFPIVVDRPPVPAVAPRLPDWTLAAGETRVLDGGVYEMNALTLGAGASLACASACEMRVRSRVRVGAGAELAPAAGIDAAEVVVIALGLDLVTPPLTKSVIVEDGATVNARVFAASGALELGRDVVATGTFVADEVSIGERAVVRKDEGRVVRVRKQSLDLRPASLTDVGAGL